MEAVVNCSVCNGPLLCWCGAWMHNHHDETHMAKPMPCECGVADDTGIDRDNGDLDNTGLPTRSCEGTE